MNVAEKQDKPVRRRSSAIKSRPLLEAVAIGAPSATAARPVGLKGRTALAFGQVYQLPPLDRVVAIKEGIDPEIVAILARQMGMARENIAKVLGLPLSTVDRKVKSEQPLSREHGESVMGLVKLIGQAQTMVEESGVSEGFDAARWVAQWLQRPVPALGNRVPADYMDTAEGRDMVSDLLATAQSGAYA